MDEYKIWIEAEHWADGECDSTNCNSDVVVTLENGTRWRATFFSYANIPSLIDKYKRSGECLSGKYFWATDMILVDEVSRSSVEEIVHHLVREGELEQVFRLIESE